MESLFFVKKKYSSSSCGAVKSTFRCAQALPNQRIKGRKFYLITPRKYLNVFTPLSECKTWRLFNFFYFPILKASDNYREICTQMNAKWGKKMFGKKRWFTRSAGGRIYEMSDFVGDHAGFMRQSELLTVLRFIGRPTSIHDQFITCGHSPHKHGKNMQTQSRSRCEETSPYTCRYGDQPFYYMYPGWICIHSNHRDRDHNELTLFL